MALLESRRGVWDNIRMADSSRIESLKDVVQKDPANALARYALANEFLKAGQYEGAIEVLRIYLEMADDEGAGYRMLASASLALGRDEEARDAYTKGIQAANRHHHPGMAAEFESALEDLS